MKLSNCSVMITVTKSWQFCKGFKIWNFFQQKCHQILNQKKTLPNHIKVTNSVDCTIAKRNPKIVAKKAEMHSLTPKHSSKQLAVRDILSETLTMLSFTKDSIGL